MAVPKYPDIIAAEIIEDLQSASAEDTDPLAFLLQLNLARAAKERAGAKITPTRPPNPRNGTRGSYDRRLDCD